MLSWFAYIVAVRRLSRTRGGNDAAIKFGGGDSVENAALFLRQLRAPSTAGLGWCVARAVYGPSRAINYFSAYIIVASIGHKP
jgi:hypothetical protein